MADKFCDPTLTTGANDGSSLANAWQDLETIMMGTLPGGTIDPGDVIHIRSDDGAGGDNTINFQGTMNDVGTVDAPVTWRVDDGTYWPNPATLINELAGSAITNSTRFNVLDGQNRLVITHTDTSGNRLGFIRVNSSSGLNFLDFRNLTINAVNTTSRRTIFIGRQSTVGDDVSRFRFENVTFGPFGTNVTGVFSGTESTRGLALPTEFIGCTFDLNNVAHNPFFALQSVSSVGRIRLENCEFINTSVSARLCDSGIVESVRTKFGTMPVSGNIPSDSGQFQHRLVAVDVECVPNDFTFESYTGVVDWRSGANYPVLNAILPDSANTGWSWRVFPNINLTTINDEFPFALPETTKFWNGAAATLDVTAEILLNNSFGTPNDNEIWFEINYVDSGGTARKETSFGSGAALTASLATWSATVYGANTYNRFNMTIRTAHTVSANSRIDARIYMGLNGTLNSDFMFFDPEFSLTAV